MPELKDNPTLADIQTYVRQLEEERGFTDQSVRDKCLIMGEEVGELFKAVRKNIGLKVDQNSKFSSVSNEVADILIFLSSIANSFNIDMEQAFREKEEINKQRNWESSQS